MASSVSNPHASPPKVNGMRKSASIADHHSRSGKSVAFQTENARHEQLATGPKQEDSTRGINPLQSRLAKLLETGTFADVCFVVGGMRMLAHRCIVSTWSPPLEALLSQKAASKVIQLREVSVDGVSADVFKLLLKFMYTGTVATMTVETAMQLLRLSRHFQVQELCEACIDSLVRDVTVETCCNILAVAGEHSERLSTILVQFIKDNFDIVGKSVSWLDLDATAVAAVVEGDDLRADHEETVYTAVVNWLTHEEDRGRFSQYLLPLVRFPLLPREFLVDNVQKNLFVMSSPVGKDLLLEAFEVIAMPNRIPPSEAAQRRLRKRRAQGTKPQSSTARAFKVLPSSVRIPSGPQMYATTGITSPLSPRRFPPSYPRKEIDLSSRALDSFTNSLLAGANISEGDE